MKTTTLLTTMLAGAAVCALSAGSALAAGHAPSIHLANLKQSPLKVHSIGFAKTNIRDSKVHNTTTHFTETITFSSTTTITSTQFVNNPTLLWGETWYATSGGKCVQPPKQKGKFQKKSALGAKIKTGSESSTNPCGTGDFTYLGPLYSLKKHSVSGEDSFSGNITAKKWHIDGTVYDLDLVANTNLSLS